VLLDGGYEGGHESISGKTSGEFSGEIKLDNEVGLGLSNFEFEKSQRASPTSLKKSGLHPCLFRFIRRESADLLELLRQLDHLYNCKKDNSFFCT
jgi:hypothetical protein